MLFFIRKKMRIPFRVLTGYSTLNCNDNQQKYIFNNLLSPVFPQPLTITLLCNLIDRSSAARVMGLILSISKKNIRN